MSDANVWQQAKLLNRYYDKIGRAATGEGCCPHLAEFRAGFGLLDETDPAHPELLAIPPDMEDIPNVFYRAKVETSYSAGTVLCKCEIPPGATAEPVRHNLIGLYDQAGELVAVCATLPDWITPNETYRAFPSIIFPYENIPGGSITPDARALPE